ncbi:Wall-associated receptor kinase [Thalictrum thalictroides]|uniref:Wall-associated receptor kinase n=1 Tax=Thalictrum thalictroides TaxID=46969 RepID=A0A7J6X7M3_THATH|nr:Wall-associated receptor kinase [Thalictrum thalictroides]
MNLYQMELFPTTSMSQAQEYKPTNIFLDRNYTAKVSDFGASKLLIPKDRTITPTRGRGTMGYLDPEYVQTVELTTMGDIYGFGVVLMELLAKQRYSHQQQQIISLTKC